MVYEIPANAEDAISKFNLDSGLEKIIKDNSRHVTEEDKFYSLLASLNSCSSEQKEQFMNQVYDKVNFTQLQFLNKNEIVLKMFLTKLALPLTINLPAIPKQNEQYTYRDLMESINEFKELDNISRDQMPLLQSENINGERFRATWEQIYLCVKDLKVDEIIKFSKQLNAYYKLYGHTEYIRTNPGDAVISSLANNRCICESKNADAIMDRIEKAIPGIQDKYNAAVKKYEAFKKNTAQEGPRQWIPLSQIDMEITRYRK